MVLKVAAGVFLGLLLFALALGALAAYGDDAALRRNCAVAGGRIVEQGWRAECRLR